MVLEQAEVLARNVGPHEGGAQQADEADGRLRRPQLIGDALGRRRQIGQLQVSNRSMLTPPHRFKPDALLVVSITLLITAAPPAGVGSCNHTLARGIDGSRLCSSGRSPSLSCGAC